MVLLGNTPCKGIAMMTLTAWCARDGRTFLRAYRPVIANRRGRDRAYDPRPRLALMGAIWLLVLVLVA